MKNNPPERYQIFLYGSRAYGNAQKWSDWDIGVSGDQPLPREILWKVEEELEESNIPFEVDVVDFSTVSDKFRRVALKKILAWKS